MNPTHTYQRPGPVTARIARNPTAGLFAALLLSACGGGGGPAAPAPGSYDLQAAMVALVTSGLSSNVNLSGSTMVSGTSYPFTGTGVLTLSPAAGGMFNGATAELQTETIAGTISVAGQSTAYSSSVVNVYESGTASIVGSTENGEFDVAQAPISIPRAIGTSPTMLGTLSRYTDSSLSVALGSVQVSVAVKFVPVDPDSPEVVQFTYSVYDTQQSLVETDTVSYDLTENNVLSLNSLAIQNSSGTLSVVPQ